MDKPDWSLMQSFLAVAETGSLSAAARTLSLSQPTLGRHIRALEEHMGMPLFDRAAKGLIPTADGARLVDPARAMRAAYHDATLQLAGQDQDLSGTVRITASAAVSFHHLARILTDLRQQQPNIQFELVASDASHNLLFREADIALRMYRPAQQELIASYLGDITFGAFASRSYLDRAGAVDLDRLRDHDLIGLLDSDYLIRALTQMGLSVTQADFGLRCDDPAIYWQMLCEGAGIGFVQSAAGQGADLVALMPQGGPRLPLWIAAHPNVRRIPRVDWTWTALKHALSRIAERP